MSQSRPAFLSAALDNVAGWFIGHPRPKSMLSFAFSGFGLVRSLWHNLVILQAYSTKLKCLAGMWLVYLINCFLL